MKIDFGCKVERGPRSSSDDRALVLGQIVDMDSCGGTDELPAVAAVCDGCGGYAGGGLAAQTVLSTLAQALPETLSDPVRLSQVLDAAQQAVLEKQRELPRYAQMCTTVAGCVFCEDRTVIFHAGDSRVYRFDGASLARMTVDHSVVQSLVDAGRMTEEESLTSPQRNTISRCIGIDCPPPEVYVSHAPIRPGETFLICSDGFWESMRDPRIKQALTDLGTCEPTEAAERLAAMALEAGSDDNVSVCLCVCRGGAGAAETAPFILD